MCRSDRLSEQRWLGADHGKRDGNLKEESASSFVRLLDAAGLQWL